MIDEIAYQIAADVTGTKITYEPYGWDTDPNHWTAEFKEIYDKTHGFICELHGPNFMERVVEFWAGLYKEYW